MAVSAVAQLHARNIIHQDIKPSNLLLDKHGALKICDYNLSRLAHEPLAGSTPMYSSPALLRGEDDGYADDWWALGVTLYQLLHGLDTWPFAPAATLAALERQPPAQQLDLVSRAVQRGRLRFRPLSGLPGASKTLLRGLLHPHAAKRWGLLQVLAGDYPPGGAYAAAAARHPALAPDMEHLLALRHLCRLSPAQLWRFHNDTQALAAQQPVIVAAAATAAPSSVLLAATNALASTGGGGGGGSDGWAAAAEQALREDERCAAPSSAPSAAASPVTLLKPPRPSLRALGSRIFRSMLSGRRRFDDLSALHAHDQQQQPQYDQQMPYLPLAVQPRSPVLRPQPVGAAVFGGAVAALDVAPPASPPPPALLAHTSSGSSSGGATAAMADAFSLELARRRAVAAISRVAALSSGSGRKAGAGAAAVGSVGGGLAAPLVPRSERAVRSASASAAVAAAAAGLLTSDGQRLVVTSKFQPCEDHTQLVDIDALREAVSHALEPAPPPPPSLLMRAPPPRVDSGSFGGDEPMAGAAAHCGRVAGIGSEAGAGVVSAGLVGACPAGALRRCGTSGLDGLPPPPAMQVTGDGQVQDVGVLEEMRRLMMARRRSAAATGTKAAAPPVLVSSAAAAAVVADGAEGALATTRLADDADHTCSGPAAVEEASKELPQLRLQRPAPPGPSQAPTGSASAAAAANGAILSRAEFSYPTTPDTARQVDAAAAGAAPHQQLWACTTASAAGPASAFAAGLVVISAAAAAATQPQGCSGSAALDLQLQSQTSQASTALYDPSSASSLKLPPPSPSTPQPAPAALTPALPCANRDGDGEVDVRLAFTSAARDCRKNRGCSGAAATAGGDQQTAAELVAELAAAARTELRRPAGVDSELVLAALAAQLAAQQHLHGALAVVHIGAGAKRPGLLPLALQQALGPLPAFVSDVADGHGKPAAAVYCQAPAPDAFKAPAAVAEVPEPPRRSSSNPGGGDGASSRGYSGSGNGSGSGILTCSRTASSCGGTSLFSLALAATGAAAAPGGSEERSSAGAFLADLADLADLHLHLHLDAEVEGLDRECAAGAGPAAAGQEQAGRRLQEQPSRGGGNALTGEEVAEALDDQDGLASLEERPTWGSGWSGVAGPAAGGDGLSCGSSCSRSSSARRGLFGWAHGSSSSTTTTGSSRSSSRREASMRSRLSGATAIAAGGGLRLGLGLPSMPVQQVHLAEEEEEEGDEGEERRECEDARAAMGQQPAQGQAQPQPWYAGAARSVDIAPADTPREGAGPAATAAHTPRPGGCGAEPAADVAVAAFGCGLLASPLRCWASKVAARARGRVAAVQA
ncbi:hypothetical protein HXX76_008177 [Chlamydomonas incerta]|uniref:Protein kinase domain-containing protein n=1 Tax=Chlamydomonas incerta TaxID=51695 RepID=A0A835T938_CHLIN|nr:hypothetical protein HXX76_008177 [Chlamydomonas incerta]|eukprot:KAG2433820.1 hypothetical protein HXX76_008177 [Chlamydomonas incerta]